MSDKQLSTNNIQASRINVPTPISNEKISKRESLSKIHPMFTGLSKQDKSIKINELMRLRFGANLSSSNPTVTQESITNGILKNTKPVNGRVQSRKRKSIVRRNSLIIPQQETSSSSSGLSSSNSEDNSDDTLEHSRVVTQKAPGFKGEHGRMFTNLKNRTRIGTASVDVKKSRIMSRRRSSVLAEYDGGLTAVELATSHSFIERFVANMRSVYSRRIFVLMFLMVSLMDIYSVYATYGWFESLKDGMSALGTAVDIRFHIREAVLHTWGMAYTTGFESESEAETRTLAIKSHLQDQYRKFVFGDDDSDVSAAAHLSSEIESLMFSSQCLMLGNHPSVKDCSNDEEYPRRMMMFHGMDTAISGFVRTLNKLIYEYFSDTPDVDSMLEFIGTLEGSDLLDIEDGFTRLLAALTSEMQREIDEVQDNLQYLGITSGIYTLLVLILNYIFLIRRLKADVAKTKFFVELLPWSIVQATPAIYFSCINDEYEANEDIGTVDI
eukprot:TRINITY_DN502_c1_g3_i2.p1 TRINITY_DN502_c1_g3~~TRINITY_DN502_c1_g3_i2.p1  ORF type:complete len:497 (+),score=122.12 TRINITY_DN502_c1_g3_i2:317-1807(+)